MNAYPPGSGTRNQPVGTRVCLLLAALAVLGALYLLVSPLERPTSQGPPFDCGSALLPADGGFAGAICGDINLRRQLQAGALGLAAVVLAGGGVLAFGPAWRRGRRSDPYDEDPDDHVPGPGGPPGMPIHAELPRRVPAHAERPVPPARPADPSG